MSTVINFCSIYNKNVTEQDVLQYIKSETDYEKLNRDLDHVLCMNVVTRDKQRAFCVFHIIKELRNRSQIPVYRWPANGLRKKITNLNDWCVEVQDTIYKNISTEVQNMFKEIV